MAENKRFRLGYVCGDYGLIDNDEWVDLHSMSENSEKNVKLCIKKMNELSDENEQLRKEYREMEIKIGKLKGEIGELFCENEQLKQQEKRLYKYFRKCFNNVSEKGFRETWEVVKKYD